MHPVSRNLSLLENFKVAGEFDSTAFKNISLVGSESAARREILTTHIHEMLSEGSKAYFLLRNYVGGMYHLTADEVIVTDERVILQEAKNTSRHRMPSLNDMKDGLLKLILYSNIDELRLNGESKEFSVRLKLTGSVMGMLSLPNTSEMIDGFCQENNLRPRERYVLAKLNEEAEFNQLQITVMGNQV